MFNVFPVDSGPLLVDTNAAFVVSVFLVLTPFKVIIVHPARLDVTNFMVSRGPGSFGASADSKCS